jgi:hypothetical protein
MKQNPAWEANGHAWIHEICAFYADLLLCSQQPNMGSYPNPKESNIHHDILLLDTPTKLTLIN